MVDPTAIAAVINGLVGTLSAYMTYKVGMKQADRPEPVTEKEQLAAAVTDLVQSHGTPDEALALAGFNKNPELFAEALRLALHEIASRTPAVADTLYELDRHDASAQGVISVVGSYNAVADRGSTAVVNVHSSPGARPGPRAR